MLCTDLVHTEYVVGLKMANVNGLQLLLQGRMTTVLPMLYL